MKSLRDQLIIFRATKEEKEKWETKANGNLSQYIRDCLNNDRTLFFELKEYLDKRLRNISVSKDAGLDWERHKNERVKDDLTRIENKGSWAEVISELKSLGDFKSRLTKVPQDIINASKKAKLERIEKEISYWNVNIADLNPPK